MTLDTGSNEPYHHNVLREPSAAPSGVVEINLVLNDDCRMTTARVPPIAPLMALGRIRQASRR
jgi:hypothetical protein